MVHLRQDRLLCRCGDGYEKNTCELILVQWELSVRDVPYAALLQLIRIIGEEDVNFLLLFCFARCRQKCYQGFVRAVPLPPQFTNCC